MLNHEYENDECSCGAKWCAECDECSDYCDCHEPPMDGALYRAIMSDVKYARAMEAL